MTGGFRLGSFGRGVEFEEEEHYPGMGHGAGYGRTTFTKQVSRPGGQSGSPIVAAHAFVQNLRK